MNNWQLDWECFWTELGAQIFLAHLQQSNAMWQKFLDYHARG